MANKLFNENCLVTMKRLPDNSIDSIVTDPPYGIRLFNKKWDYDIPSIEIWQEALRILKPGAHMLVSCGTKTQHKMASTIEDAGFEIRDIIVYAYGSGFPKSMDVSKAIDQHLGLERDVVGTSNRGSGAQPSKLNNHEKGDTGIGYMDGSGKIFDITIPASEEAKQYEGFGTQLKPALEFWTLVRKPLSEPTIAKNVLKHTTGAINIDISRIPTTDKLNGGHTSGSVNKNDGWDRPWKSDKEAVEAMAERSKLQVQKSEQLGRFPSNLILDDSEEVIGLFPNTKSHKERSDNYAVNDTSRDNCVQLSKHKHHFNYGREHTTSASRFFYTAKASKSEKI